MRALLTSPRILRTGHPLSLEQVRSVAPAVFAEGPHESRGQRYMYVPTIDPVQKMLENGWAIYEASQQRSRKQDRDPYTKHMLRLRKEADFEKRAIVGDGVPEVVLINAHDGSAAYKLIAGWFRFICANGMMVGNTLAGFTVRHTISIATSQAVLEAGERTITEKFPLLIEQRERMTLKVINSPAQYRLAEHALKLRYGSTVPPFAPDDLLKCRRPEDEEPTLWNVLNRIQENVIDGGWEVKSRMYARRSIVRPVERVSSVANINGGLWDAAMELCQE